MVNFMEIVDFDDTESAKKVLTREAEDVSSFTISNEEEAEDVMGKVAWAIRTIDQNNEKVSMKKTLYDNQLEEYRHRLNAGLESYLEYGRSRLEDYARRTLKDKKGTVKLMHGNLRLATPTVTYNYNDEDALLQWLIDNKKDKCIRTKKSIDKVTFKKEFTEINDQGTELLAADNAGVKQAIPGIRLEKEDGLAFKMTIPQPKVSNKDLPKTAGD